LVLPKYTCAAKREGRPVSGLQSNPPTEASAQTHLADQVSQLDLHVLDGPADVGDVRRRTGERDALQLGLPRQAPSELDRAPLTALGSAGRKLQHDGRGQLVRGRPAALVCLENVDRVPGAFGSEG
jgi:hypothetical protein